MPRGPPRAESVLNDAVAIVLVRILQSLGPGAFAHPSAFLLGVFQFVWVSLGSILVGISIALPSAVLLRRVNMASHSGGGFELSLLLLLGYSAYPTAEAVHCSGILALFVCSVLMGHYHVHSLSPHAVIATELTLKSIAHLTETFVFMYMGMDLVAQRGAVDDMFDEDNTASGEEKASSTRLFVAFAILIVPLARFFVVPPLVLVANCWRGRKRSLSRRDTAFLVFAGLRGAIAYALARSSASAHQRTIVAATTAVVLFTTFVLGGTTRLMLNYLGMIDAQGDKSSSAHAPAAASPLGTADVDLKETRADGGGLAARFHSFDAQYLQPVFGGPGLGPAAAGRGDKPPREVELKPMLSSDGRDTLEHEDTASEQ